MTSRQPSLTRIAQYVREEMIDGATEAAVMARGYHTDRASTTVRWRVWARLKAEGYSYSGIARSTGVDHGTIIKSLRQLAKGRTPYAGNGCAHRRAPTVKKPPRLTSPGLIRFAGYDPTERHIGEAAAP